MSLKWQLDGSCSANGCCDGSSDEPCAHVDLAAKPATQDELVAVPAGQQAPEPAAEPAAKDAPKKTGYFGTSEEPKKARE